MMKPDEAAMLSFHSHSPILRFRKGLRQLLRPLVAAEKRKGNSEHRSPRSLALLFRHCLLFWAYKNAECFLCLLQHTMTSCQQLRVSASGGTRKKVGDLNPVCARCMSKVFVHSCPKVDRCQFWNSQNACLIG